MKKEHLLFLAFGVLMVARTASSMVGAYPDIWGHMVCGLDHLSSGALSRTDHYSYTAAGALFMDHAWLSEWIFAYAWSSFGMIGLWAMRLIVVALVFGLILARIMKTTRGFWPGFAIYFISSLAITKYLVFRPLLFTAALFAFFLYVILDARSDGKTRSKAAFLFVPLMALWANLHGGFLIGLCLLGWFVFCLGIGHLHQRTDRKMFLPGLVMVVLAGLATLFNPYGVGLWQWLLSSLLQPRSTLITEWAPAFRFAPQYAVLFFYVLNGLAVITFFKTRRERDLFEWGLLAAVGTATWFNIRHEMIFTITAAMILPKYLESIDPKFSGGLKISRSAAYGFVIFSVLYAVLIHTRPGHRPATLYVEGHPANAYRFIKENRLKGNLLVSFDWGQSAIWYLKDRCKVAFDGRFRTVYPRDVEDAYFRFHAFERQWDDILNRYPTNMVLIPVDWPAAKALMKDPNWLAVHRGPLSSFSQQDVGEAVLFVRKKVFSDIEQSMKEGRLIDPEVTKKFIFK